MSNRQVLTLAAVATVCLVGWLIADSTTGAITVASSALLILGLVIGGVAVIGAWLHPNGRE